jgi:hypothetical protein
MGDTVNFGSMANRCEPGAAAFGDNDGAKVRSETRVGQGNSFQDAKPLPRVPAGGPYDVCTLPVAAAPVDNGVCELEYCVLPPVCVADDEAAAADAARARTGGCPSSENMIMPAGPAEWNDVIPIGWKKYEGVPSVFHCGFRGLVADCHPDRDHLQNEVFYNDEGQRVKNADDAKTGDYVDIDYRCAGTPNADDASEHPGWHIFTKGGLIREGWGGFVGSILYYDRQQHELENETDPPDSNEGK